MDSNAPIYQLRQNCPALVSVAGSAEQSVAQSIADLPMPAAYVIPLSQESTQNENMTGLFQTVTETFAVMVCFDNRVGNGIGQATANQSFGTMTIALHSALLNWEMDQRAVRGVQFQGANLVSQDRARAWYRWIYSYEYTLSEDDGFQPPSDDIEEIDVTVMGDIVGSVKFSSS